MIRLPRNAFCFQNALTDKPYRLVAVDSALKTEENIQVITKICNEADVYNWCFREKCSDAPYHADLAVEFFDWAVNGWANSTHFVFAVIDSEGIIAATCDIKSSDLSGAEIGYLSSIQHKGVMTNAIKCLIEFAQTAGFRKLIACIHKDNLRSHPVVTRCGFELSGEDQNRPDHISYKRDLYRGGGVYK